MFTLSDDIDKFASTVLTLPDNIMTLDQRFLGGGIKMQDLISENSFIISEMRKIKEVFINYCKLNDKVYRKIVEHEVNASEHFNKILSVSMTIDRRLEQSQSEMKEIRTDIFRKVAAIQESLNDSLYEIKQQINSKVSEIGFVQNVYKIIEKYEQENASSSCITSDNQIKESVLHSNGNGLSQSASGGKRRRGLTMEDIEMFKAQITPLIDEINSKISLHSQDIEENKLGVSSLSAKISKLQQEITWLGEDFVGLRNTLEDAKVVAKEEDLKVVAMLREATNDDVWGHRLNGFYSQFVAPPIHDLMLKLDKSVDCINCQINQILRPRFGPIQAQLKKIQLIQKLVEGKFKQTQSKMGELNTLVQQNRKQTRKQIQFSIKKVEKSLAQSRDQESQHFAKIQDSIKTVKNVVEQTISTTEDQVLKRCELRLGQQIKQIHKGIHSLHVENSQTNAAIKSNAEQIKHIRDLVATKANYTDLVMYYDRKADKQEMQELQQLITESPKANNNRSLQLFDESQMGKRQGRREIEDRSKRRVSFTKRTSTPAYTKGDDEQNRRIFIGWPQSPENQSRQAVKSVIRQSYTTNMRNKSVRPSTANTLFLL